MTKRYTIDEGYTLLLEIYVHLMEIYELIGMNSMKPVKEVWSLIFDEDETGRICDYLGSIRPWVVECCRCHAQGPPRRQGERGVQVME